MKTRNSLNALIRSALLIALTAAMGCAGVPVHRGSSLDAEHNKGVARLVYEEGLSRGVFRVPYAPTFVGHSGATNFTHDQGRAEAQGWRSAFPDLTVTADNVIGEADMVSVRWTARGTNTGAGNGIQPTGKNVVVSGITMFRFADGAIAEEWTSGDALGLMRQLGLIPGGASAPARSP